MTGELKILSLLTRLPKQTKMFGHCREKSVLSRNKNKKHPMTTVLDTKTSCKIQQLMWKRRISVISKAKILAVLVPDVVPNATNEELKALRASVRW